MELCPTLYQQDGAYLMILEVEILKKLARSQISMKDF